MAPFTLNSDYSPVVLLGLFAVILCAPGPPPNKGRPVSVSINSPFNFGTIARDDTTTCTLKIGHNGSASVTSGDCYHFGGHNVGQFSVQGLHHHRFTYSTSWSGFGSSGTHIDNSDFNFSKSCQSGCSIPRGARTTTIKVGGDIELTPQAQLGETSGTLEVTVSYY